MSGASTDFAPSPAAATRRGVLVAVHDDGGASGRAVVDAIQARLAATFPGEHATVQLAAPAPELAGAGLASGGISGAQSPLGALLREAERRGCGAAALIAASPRDETVDWLRLLLAPILEGGFDYVCPTYRRRKLDGMLSTAIVAPLTRALYGRWLRQPAGGEAAVSLELARALLADADWRIDPAEAGSDAWLVAKALASGARVCQAWLGAWPGRESGAPEDAAHALERLVGPVFREMERHAARWQRVDGSGSVPSFGDPGAMAEEPWAGRVEELAAAFRLGVRELGDLWGLVLPPGTMFALRRAAAATGVPRLPDALWVRIVYDFAVAHFTRAVERRQLLRAMTPLYLGWVAGFVGDVGALDERGTEERVEALCLAYEHEKPYAISRWRWPESFNP